MIVSVILCTYINEVTHLDWQLVIGPACLSTVLLDLVFRWTRKRMQRGIGCERKESLNEELGQADNKLVAGRERAVDPVSLRKGRRLGSGKPDEKNTIRSFIRSKQNKIPFEEVSVAESVYH